MNHDETVARLEVLMQAQRHAERMMLAGMIHANDKGIVDAALDEAVAANGLKMPVHMHSVALEILDALLSLMDQGIRPTAAALIDDFLSNGGAAPEKIIRLLCAQDPDQLDAVESGRRLGAVGAERYRLGQRVWPEALYRWFDWDDRLLYVGITRDMATRQGSHALKSSWSRFSARCMVERAPTRAVIEAMEYSAIKSEKPLFNHTHNDTPEARQRLVAYLVEHGHLDLLAPAVSRG